MTMTLRNRSNQWGLISIAIHWISALTIIGLFVLGLWMVELTYYDDWYQKGPALHESIGITLFVLTLIRLLLQFFYKRFQGSTKIHFWLSLFLLIVCKF